MLIFHDLKLIQIVVPRTGSNSFRASLMGKYKAKWVHTKKPLRYVWEMDTIGMYGHFSAKQAKVLIDDDIWKSYEKVGFVRHPYDWIKSVNNINGLKQVLGERLDTSLSEFVHEFKKTIYDWFTDEDGNLIIDTIYRTEDLDQIFEKYGVSNTYINQTQKPKNEEFTEKDKKIIREKFYREFKHYED